MAKIENKFGKDAVRIPLDQLKETGLPFDGLVLKAGDKVRFPEMDDMDPHIVHKRGIATPSINCWINGRDESLAAFKAFRKTPMGEHAEKFCDEFKTNGDIVNCGSDADFCKLVAGKTLTVEQVVKRPKPIFATSIRDGQRVVNLVRNEDGSPKEQPGNFAVFSIA